MLRTKLLKWCQNEYDHSSAKYCGQNCNNKDYCHHDCAACLNQVHWFPRYGGRRDYDCPFLLLKYILSFTDKYSSQIASALSRVDLSRYPRYHIFSIGCGAAPDLMAFEEETSGKQIYYKGYDRNPLWKGIHDGIEEYSGKKGRITAKFRRRDIFDVFAEGKPRNQQYNVVVIQYLISHLYNTGQEDRIGDLFDYIIENILLRRLSSSPFLIIITDIDSINKGRDSWYHLLNKLEDRGYSGKAYVRSAFPKGDLGSERWGSRYRSQSRRGGTIDYEYFENDSEHDGAQLVIELR